MLLCYIYVKCKLHILGTHKNYFLEHYRSHEVVPCGIGDILRTFPTYGTGFDVSKNIRNEVLLQGSIREAAKKFFTRPPSAFFFFFFRLKIAGNGY